MTRQVHAVAAASCAMLLAAPALAAPRAETVQTRLDALEKTVAAQEQQLERQQQLIDAQAAELQRLRLQGPQAVETAAAAQAAPLVRSVEAQQTQIAALEDAAAQQKLRDQDKPRLSLPGGRPTIASADGRYTLAVRGLVQADAGHYFQDAQGPAALDFRRGSLGATANRETNAAQDLSDGAYFRRARLGVEGTLNRDFGYRFVAEFGGSGTEGPARINDAWISYTGFAPFTLMAGAFSPPANMDDGTSPEDTLFLERASSSELSRSLGGADGRLGVGVRTATQRWMGALTFTSRTVNDAEVFDSQAAVVGRVGHLLLTSDDYNVHVGASGTYVFAPADQGSTASPRDPLRLRERPEFRLDSTRLIDTGSLDAEHAYAAGVEFAAQYRNLYLQAENFWFGVERRAPTALGDPRFRGFYVQGSWVLTGEPHRYNMATGSFQSPRPYTPFRPGGGMGAWEIAARFSETNLNYREGAAGFAPPADGVRGGDQRIWTLGLNWYPNANLRFMLDYLHVDVDRLNPAGPGALAPFGPGTATPPIGAQIGQTADIVAVRSQFAF